LSPRSQSLLDPRKSPVQARSTASVDAILEATVQVLLDLGKERLTTTRVASRAGVSVETLYQYFPNRIAVESGDRCYVGECARAAGKGSPTGGRDTAGRHGRDQPEIA
jgi:hypothetical protein